LLGIPYEGAGIYYDVICLVGNSPFAFFKEPKRKEILWKNIKKIGSDMIIIEND
jgi:sporulation protein YlmC with PRC-barrel domain